MGPRIHLAPVMEHLLPAGVDVRTLLGTDFDLREGRARTATTTFYDTFDGRLYADGVTLRHTDGRLALVDRESGEELASAEATAARRLFIADLPEPLRERLADAIEMRALTVIARVRGRRRPVAVLNEDAKTVVRLTVEDSRITTTGVRGYEDELERVHALLPRRCSRSSTRWSWPPAGAPRGRAPSSTSCSIPTSPPPRRPRPCSRACSR